MSMSAIQGPGILFVRSRISPTSKDILDECTFLKWYDDEHIAEVVSTSGIQSAFRYVDVSKSSPTGDSQNLKPFLAVYPMRDLTFTLSDEFKKINVKSDNLPGSGIIYDLADMDVSYLGFMGATPRKEGDGGEHAKYVLSSGVRPEKEAGIESIQSFYEQQTSILSQSPHFVRTLRYKLLYARTNAQSRALKGLPTTEEAHPEPSTWLAMHEFSDLPDGRALGGMGGEQGAVWGNAEMKVHVWRLDCMHEEGTKC